MLRTLLVGAALALMVAAVLLLVAAAGHLPGEPEAGADPPQHSTGTSSTQPDVQPKHQAPPTTTTTTTTAPPTTTTTAPPAPAKMPVPTTAPIIRTGSCAGWGDLLAAYFPADQVDRACSVMLCESGGNPTAANPSSSASGLFQFLSGTWESTTGQPAPASAYSPEAQIGAAAQLWQRSGWSPWSCA